MTFLSPPVVIGALTIFLIANLICDLDVYLMRLEARLHHIDLSKALPTWKFKLPGSLCLGGLLLSLVFASFGLLWGSSIHLENMLTWLILPCTVVSHFLCLLLMLASVYKLSTLAD